MAHTLTGGHVCSNIRIKKFHTKSALDGSKTFYGYIIHVCYSSINSIIQLNPPSLLSRFTSLLLKAPPLPPNVLQINLQDVQVSKHLLRKCPPPSPPCTLIVPHRVIMNLCFLGSKGLCVPVQLITLTVSDFVDISSEYLWGMWKMTFFLNSANAGKYFVTTRLTRTAHCQMKFCWTAACIWQKIYVLKAFYRLLWFC